MHQQSHAEQQLAMLAFDLVIVRKKARLESWTDSRARRNPWRVMLVSREHLQHGGSQQRSDVQATVNQLLVDVLFGEAVSLSGGARAAVGVWPHSSPSRSAHCSKGPS